MSEFSDYLDNYIREKKYTVSRFAAKMNKDRSMLYRYVKGTRVPSDESLVSEMAKALCMTVPEKNNLLELYERLIYGDEKIDNYVYFKSFLEKLKECENSFLSNNNILWKANIDFDHFNLLWLNSENEIISIIRYLLSRISNVDTDGQKCMYIIMQPDNKIQEYIRPCLENTSVAVEQIIHLEQRDQLKYKNLEALLKVLGTCFGSLDYSIYYYFSADTDAEDYMSWMANVIIIGDYVVQFDKAVHYGSVVNDAEYAAGALERYKKIKKNTNPLKKDVCFKDDMNNFYGEKEYETCASGLFFEPCVRFAVGRDVLDGSLHDFPERKQFIDYREAVSGSWNNIVYHPSEIIKQMDTVHIRFKYDGLIRFMETGRTSEFPDGLYEPLDMSQRVLTLKRAIELSRKGYIAYYIIDESVEVPERISIYSYSESKRLQFSMHAGTVVSQVIVNESGFYYMFESYTVELERRGLVKTREETLKILQEVYGQYKGRL